MDIEEVTEEEQDLYDALLRLREVLKGAGPSLTPAFKTLATNVEMSIQDYEQARFPFGKPPS